MTRAAAAGKEERARSLWAEASDAITPTAMLTVEQWQALGEAHLDLTKAARLVKDPSFCIPRHQSDLPSDVRSGQDHHHLHILLLEHRVATRD